MHDLLIYRVHADTAVTQRELGRLRRELAGHPIDVLAVGYGARRPVFAGPDVCMLDRDDLLTLPYPGKLAFLDFGLPIGGNDLPVLHAFRTRPGYRHYWTIEYDVRYTGDWAALFDTVAASTADLLCTNLLRHADDPAFHWWHTLVTPDALLPDAALLRGFLPFCRASNRLLAAIDAAYAAGLAGHSEVVWPTIGAQAGLTLADLGGDGPFTPADWRGRHYTSTPLHWTQSPGTFAYLPAIADADFRPDPRGGPMLWHPVK